MQTKNLKFMTGALALIVFSVSILGLQDGVYTADANDIVNGIKQTAKATATQTANNVITQAASGKISLNSIANNATQNITNNALNMGNQAVSDVTGGVLGSGSASLGNIINNPTGAVTDIATNALNNALGNATGGLLGGSAASATGTISDNIGQFSKTIEAAVPDAAQELTGGLSDLAKDLTGGVASDLTNGLSSIGQDLASGVTDKITQVGADALKGVTPELSLAAGANGVAFQFGDEEIGIGPEEINEIIGANLDTTQLEELLGNIKSIEDFKNLLGEDAAIGLSKKAAEICGKKGTAAAKACGKAIAGACGGCCGKSAQKACEDAQKKGEQDAAAAASDKTITNGDKVPSDKKIEKYLNVIQKTAVLRSDKTISAARAGADKAGLKRAKTTEEIINKTKEELKAETLQECEGDAIINFNISITYGSAGEIILSSSGTDVKLVPNPDPKRSISN